MISTLQWAIDRIPAWMRGVRSAAWQAGIWKTTETIVRATREAVRARYPSKTAPSNLSEIATERRIERGRGETAAQFARRLSRAHQSKRAVGTSAGIQRELRAAGFPTATVYEAHDWPGSAPNWAHFWVLIEDPSLVSTTWSWNDGTKWNDGARWGGVDEDAKDLIRRIILQNKGPHTKLVTVIVVVTGKAWNTGWKWNDGTRWNGRGVRFGL